MEPLLGLGPSNPNKPCFAPCGISSPYGGTLSHKGCVVQLAGVQYVLATSQKTKLRCGRQVLPPVQLSEPMQLHKTHDPTRNMRDPGTLHLQGSARLLVDLNVVFETSFLAWQLLCEVHLTLQPKYE